MHFQSLVLLALSAGALAIPSPHKHINTDSHPSIAPYSDLDCTVQAGPSVDFDQASNACTKVTWTEDNAGINWGNDPYSMYSFYVFSDDNCQVYAAPRINNTNGGNDLKGANACYSMRLNGGPWKSVMQYWPPVE